MKLREGHVPPGGWHFVVADGVKLTGINKESLTKQIFEFRLRNNIPMGDIEREIDAYYCRQWPSACWKEPHEQSHKAPAAVVHKEPMLNRVSRWASTVLRKMPPGGAVLANPTDAHSRAKICANCPKNVPWWGGCAGCSKSTTTVLAQIKRMSRTPLDSQLHGCSVAGWENQSAIWFGPEYLEITAEQRNSLAPNCWRRDLP
jgi:hypothetical protein